MLFLRVPNGSGLRSSRMKFTQNIHVNTPMRWNILIETRAIKFCQLFLSISSTASSCTLTSMLSFRTISKLSNLFVPKTWMKWLPSLVWLYGKEFQIWQLCFASSYFELHTYSMSSTTLWRAKLIDWQCITKKMIDWYVTFNRQAKTYYWNYITTNNFPFWGVKPLNKQQR